MKLRFGDYLLTNGWGGTGFYDHDRIVGMENVESIPYYATLGKARIDYFPRPIIPPDAVVCGTGSGYEEFLFQKEVCDTIVRYMDEESQEHE